MKFQKKWPIAIVAMGLLGIGLLFIQTPKGVNQENVNKPFKGTLEKQGSEIKLEASNNTNLTKTPNNHLHVEYDQNFVDTFDEMEIFDDTNEGAQLKALYNLLENSEPESQQLQDEYLEKMRETPEEYIAKLTEIYDEVDQSNFLARYKVVYMMENIKTPHAVPFLTELANSELPEETIQYKGDGDIDKTHHEGMIRMRAVGGLHALASEDNKEARDSLLNVVLEAKDQTVKNDAIWAYLSTSKDIDADKEYLKSALPENEHQLVTLKLDDIEGEQKKLELEKEGEPL